MKRIIFLLIGIFILAYACIDDDYIPERVSTASIIEEILPDSTNQEPDTSEVPVVVPPEIPVTVPVELSNVYLLGHAVRSIEFEDDYVWAATDSYFVKLDLLNKTITYYPYPFTTRNGSSFNLKIDTNGIKWLGYSEYSRNTSIYESYSSSIYSFDGNLWGQKKSIGHGLIYSLAIDKNNNKWIAKMGNDGLYVIEQDNCIQYTPENSGLIYNWVAQVASDKDGNIWLCNCGNLGGLLSADITLIKYEDNNWIPYFWGRHISIAFLVIDHKGNPWVQSLGDLQKLDVTSNSWSEQISLQTPPLFQIVSAPKIHTFDEEDELWFVKEKEGIALYNDGNWRFYTRSNSNLPSDTVYQIAIDSHGKKWIGTANGLATLNDLEEVYE